MGRPFVVPGVSRSKVVFSLVKGPTWVGRAMAGRFGVRNTLVTELSAVLEAVAGAAPSGNREPNTARPAAECEQRHPAAPEQGLWHRRSGSVVAGPGSAGRYGNVSAVENVGVEGARKARAAGERPRWTADDRHH
ncbi:hypothetical protein HUO13_35105 [Saccharopolyspora erythraea]|uniref:hypothetical protein n=1 Tax=Saccharopolyspora erythraea TaxID=1836 RepID=UPI001BAC17EB|nr:hypothetical protein [Saccharopolyspora erythraea]QUH05315.1 hypothetical protein HUO13_35105 [Saccharopolyspora erythraea]